MANLALLKAEIIVDTFRVYSAMSNEEVADSLNTVDRTINKTSLSGDEVFANIDSRTDWDALTDTQKTQFLAFCGRDSIDPFGSANVELVKAIFGDASATVVNLQAARLEPVSRATEINIGFVREGDVEYVRNN